MVRYLDLEHAPPTDSGGEASDVPVPVGRNRRRALKVAGIAFVGFLAVAGIALVASRGTSFLSSDAQEFVGLAEVKYDRIGYGKCLVNGKDPEHKWFGSGDVKAMCSADADCMGYSASHYGGGLLWMSGPLQGGGASWGGCDCRAKVKATTAAPTTTPAPPPTTQKAPEAAGQHNGGAEDAGDDQGDASDADVEGATEFPNIHLIASGYNIFYSDPLPKMDLKSDEVNVDPGLRKPVFSIKYNKNRLTGDRRHKRPDGYFATVDYGCSEVFSTKTISDDYAMSTERNLEASVTDQYGLDIDMPPTSDQFSFQHGDKGVQDTGGAPVSLGAFVGGSGTLSGSYKHVREENMLKDNRIVQSSAKCAVYTAGIAYGFPPDIDPDFKAKVDAASDKRAWWEIFDDFGTHFLSNIKMGARFGSMMIFKKDHYDAMYSTVVEAGLEVGPVIEAGVKTMVSMPEIEDMLSFEFDPKLKLPDVPLLNQQSVEKVTSHASAQAFQGIGPKMPPGGVSKWIDEVAQNPVPLRYSKQEICAHPGLTSDQLTACSAALQVYCEQYLEPKGATCEPPEKQQCQMDSDCEQGRVCRSFICEKVPVCYVTVYSGGGYSGNQYVLDPVNSIDHPSGRPISLRLANWHDKIESFKMGQGCKKVKLYDDDPGNAFEGWAQNKEYTSSAGGLESDLEHDVRMIEVWANDVPGTPPFQPGLQEAPGNLPKAPKISYEPEKDVFFVEPTKSTGLNVDESADYFSNIGKAMYGYNHFHGAPFSTKYAGSDPGFQGRGVWKMTYEGGAVGVEAEWKRLPMAPNARYFVMFARKHPQLDQVQEDAKNPNAAAIRYLQGNENEVKQKLQDLKDDKLGFYPWFSFWQEQHKEERYVEPELPVSEVSEEFCGLQHSIRQTIEEIDSVGREKYSKEVDDYWQNSYWRRLFPECAADVPDNVGNQYCKDGKVAVWTQDDQDEVEACWAEQSSYYDDWRRLQAKHKQNSTQAAVPRRLYWAEDASEWYSCEHEPNIREFSSLSTAKQALRSEVGCLGKFRGEACPSGADYNLKVEGTTWNFENYCFDPWDDCPSPEVELSKKFKEMWPRFIVKVVDEQVVEVEVIDDQDQQKGWKTGFDSAFPHHAGRNSMLDFLKEYVAKNPSNGEAIGEESALATKVPDGWKVTRAKGGGYCEQDFKTDTVSDAHSYEKLTSSSFGIPKTGATVMGSGFNFGLSYEKKDLLKNQGQKGEKMLATQAECGAYFAEIVDLENNPPPTEPSLAFLAGKAVEESDFWTIFDQYGLHFPTEVVFGARYGTSQYIKESSFMEYHRSEESLSLDFGVQVAVPTQVPGVDVQASRDVSIGYSGTDSEKHMSNKYFEERRTFSIGKRLPAGGISDWLGDIGGEPMPIKFSLEPLCNHPAFKSKQAQCSAASDTYCEKHLMSMHPEVECGGTPKSECLWDNDCDHAPNAVCTLGVCAMKPACQVEIFKETSFRGGSTKVGPVFYEDHRPYIIFDLGDMWGWKGKVRSMKLSGGCAKVVKMTSNNLDGTDNLPLTNHKSNSGKDISDVSGVNYLALYPKEVHVDENSEWFQDKR